MQKIYTKTRNRGQIKVRRDRQRSKLRLSLDRNFVEGIRPEVEASGDWRTWWQRGCKGIDHSSVCIPGHAYFVERYYRKARAKSKITGRRKVRRRLNRIETDE